MSEHEAGAMPLDTVMALWDARSRRTARLELRELEDRLAVAGLQSPVEVKGEAKKPKKTVIAVGLEARREQLRKDAGYVKVERTPEDKDAITLWDDLGELEKIPLIDMGSKADA